MAEQSFQALEQAVGLPRPAHTMSCSPRSLIRQSIQFWILLVPLLANAFSTLRAGRDILLGLLRNVEPRARELISLRLWSKRRRVAIPVSRSGCFTWHGLIA
jgi:hypothetical protein